MAEKKGRGLFQRLTEALFEEVGPDDGKPRPLAEPLAEAPVAPPPPRPVVAEMPPPAPPQSASPERKVVATTPVDRELEEMFGAAKIAEKAANSDRPSENARSGGEMAHIHANFETRLAQILEQGRNGVAGKLQLLDLDEIKRRAGDRWASIADKAYVIAEQVINKRLAPSDVMAPFDGDSYVILFAELTEEQARMKSAAIVREVRDRLLGELDMEGDRNWVRAFVTEVKPIAEVRPAAAEPGAASQATGDPAEPPLVAATRAATAILSLQGLSDALDKAEDCTPQTPGGTHQIADRDLQRRVGELGVSYRPTLLPARGVISVYDSRVQRLDELNRVSSGAAAYRNSDPAVMFEMDRAVLGRALRDLRSTIAANHRAVVLVPLHVPSLLGHVGGLLVDPCRELPPDFRSYLVIELVATQPGSVGRIHEAIALLQPFCRAITARILPGFIDFERFSRLRVTSVGIDLDDPEMGEVTPAILTQSILPLAERAHSHKLQAHLYGIRRKEIAVAARHAGFDYLNGPAVVPEWARPMGVVPMGPNSGAARNG